MWSKRLLLTGCVLSFVIGLIITLYQYRKYEVTADISHPLLSDKDFSEDAIWEGFFDFLSKKNISHQRKVGSKLKVLGHTVSFNKKEKGTLNTIHWNAAGTEAALNPVAQWMLAYLNESQEKEKKKGEEKLKKLEDLFSKSLRDFDEPRKESDQLGREDLLKQKEKSLFELMTQKEEALNQFKETLQTLKILDEVNTFSLTDIHLSLPSIQHYKHLENVHAKLKNQLRPGHPRLTNIASQLQSAKQAIFKDLESESKNLENQLSSISGSLEEIREKIRKLFPLHQKMKLIETKIAKHKNDYEEALSQYAEKETITSLPASFHVRVKKDWDSLKTNALTMGIIFGLFCLLFGLNIGFERVFNPLHKIKTLYPKIPLVGVLPHIKINEDYLVAHYEPSHLYSQSIDAIKLKLLFGEMKFPFKTIAIVPPEKKRDSLFITNLAISFSKSQKKTLLIDCMINNPSIHRYFEIPNHGWTDILKDKKDWKEARQSCKIPNLDLLPMGEGEGREGLFSEAFSSLLSQIRYDYDFIFIALCPRAFQEAIARWPIEGVCLNLPHSWQKYKKCLDHISKEREFQKIPWKGLVLEKAPSQIAKKLLRREEIET